MTVTEEQLDNFITLFKKELAIELTPTEARFRAESLLYFIACSFERGDAENSDNDILTKPDLSENTPNIFVLKNGQ